MSFKFTLKLLAAIAIGMALCQFPLHYLESITYDARIRFSPAPANSDNIAIVKIDQKTLTLLGRNPNLIDLGLMIRSLDSEAPKKIVSVLPAPTNSINISERAFFAKATQQVTNFYINLDDVPSDTEQSLLTLAPPLSHIQIIPGAFSSDVVNFAADDVSRRTAVFYNNKFLMPALIAQDFLPTSSPFDYRGAFKYRTSVQVYTNYRKQGSYKEYSFSDVLEKRFPKGSFSGKIVLIGSDTRAETTDYLRTPFNRDALAMPKVEVFANMVETLIQNDGIIRPPTWLDTFVTVLVCLLTLYFTFNLRPLKGFVALLSTAIGYIFIAWAVFALFRVSITMTHPLLAIFVSYYFFIPYRLIKESQKSWEYQQKNKLLTQVEELKTNFLSMMSHDLKTPLARIQGMTDIALSHSENLNTDQKQALTTISDSTQELSNFISSILDLGRIESEEVKLHLQSKDINSLLEDVLRKYEFQARQKNIEFVREFEPLFSTKIDIELMRQVFANLIENALKYSPEGSKILISTEEHEGQIVVQVADQGIGIPASEVSNVFMKFYRSKEVKNTPIKGSGLGLFLAKYFVELHKGKISVESVPHQGSTFTVNLPMQ